MKRFISMLLKFVLPVLLLLVVPMLSFAQSSSAPLPSNVYAAGASFNRGADHPVAGTGLYARLLSDGSGTYAFTVVDAVPVNIKPFSVTTNFSGGVAQKLPFSVGKFPIYVPTAAGISFKGTNTGWAWSTGGMTQICRNHWCVLPNVRILKSSVSDGEGYQPIFGVLLAREQ